MLFRRTGQLLVASRQLLDPNFARTVVFVVSQDDNGVIGLILNRPLELTVAEACDPSAEEAAGVSDTLFQGGPCAGPLMVLHADPLIGSGEIIPGVRFAAERDEIESLMRDHNGPIRYFAGYSGWSPKQLEDEIEQGAWLTAPANASQVFSDSESSQWSMLSTRLTVGRFVNIDEMPEDPTTN